MPTLPHRADHVGSLLRPARLAATRQRWREGDASPDELRTVEDESITELVAQQERVGLHAVTDGEFRRDWWHLDFLAGFAGIGMQERERPASFQGLDVSPPMPVIVDEVRHTAPIFVDAFSYLAEQTSRTPKLTIPGPAMANQLGGPAAIDRDVYPDLDDFWSDLVDAYREEVAQLYAAGCRYLQLDDVSFAYLCDPAYREKMAERGEPADALVVRYRDAMNAVIAGRPDDLLITTHMCRGNFRSKWVASGGYAPVAEAVFGGLDVDAFFLEFDSDRAGGFEPLAHVPEGKIAVLGLVTSKTPELEVADMIVARLHEAAKILPMEQLAISPQCGFSSTHHGNDLTPDDQWAKLELCVQIAERCWGES
jgi:5-methyltetrahydropteroyltriglutamate--homocysteine methyltransferase